MNDPNRITALYEDQGQSAWLDNLKRGYITSGQLVAIRDRGVRGLTSNPSIFQKAIAGSDDYDEQFRALRSGRLERGSLDHRRLLVARDHGHPQRLRRLLQGVRPLRRRRRLRQRRGRPGPRPRRSGHHVGCSRTLHERIDRRNLMVKIPGTDEGLAAIEEMIAEGRSINVTLIFSLPVATRR